MNVWPEFDSLQAQAVANRTGTQPHIQANRGLLSRGLSDRIAKLVGHLIVPGRWNFQAVA